MTKFIISVAGLLLDGKVVGTVTRAAKRNSRLARREYQPGHDGLWDAEDLAQEAFLRAYRSLKGFRGTSSFRTWLYQIATNVFRNWLEKRRNQAPVNAGSIDAPPPGMDEPVEPMGEENPEAQHLQRDAIDRALAELPDDQREAVLLRDVEGFEYREIAEQLGVPLGTVESRIFRGRSRLKELLRSAGLRS